MQSMDRADEVMAIAERNGWKVIVGVEPDKPESRRTRWTSRRSCKEEPPDTSSAGGRCNDPCPCGSGRKFKRCC